MRRDLQQLVVGEEFKALLQAHLARAGPGAARRPQPEARMLVSCFFLQTLTVMSSCLGQTPTTMPSYTGTPAPMNSDAALLRVEEAVGDALAGLEGDEGAGVAARQISPL